MMVGRLLSFREGVFWGSMGVQYSADDISSVSTLRLVLSTPQRQSTQSTVWYTLRATTYTSHHSWSANTDKPFPNLNPILVFRQPSCHPAIIHHLFLPWVLPGLAWKNYRLDLESKSSVDSENNPQRANLGRLRNGWANPATVNTRALWEMLGFQIAKNLWLDDWWTLEVHVLPSCRIWELMKKQLRFWGKSWDNGPLLHSIIYMG